MATTVALISNGGKITKLADEAMNRYRLVEEGSDADHVKLLDAGTDVATGMPMGLTVDGADAAEDALAIALLGRGDTKVMTINGTCSKGAWLTGEAPGVDAGGKVRAVPATAGAYWVVGRALEDGADEQEIAVDDCQPFLAGPQDANGQLGIPCFAGDPSSPIEATMWYDLTNDKYRVKNGTSTATINVTEE